MNHPEDEHDTYCDACGDCIKCYGEVRQHLIDEGVDPDAMVDRVRAGIEMTIAECTAKREGRLIDTKDTWDNRTQH